jgi:hypothetical protein
MSVSTAVQSRAMAPEERKEPTEMSAAAMPCAAPSAQAAMHKWCIRTDEETGFQDPVSNSSTMVW